MSERALINGLAKDKLSRIVPIFATAAGIGVAVNDTADDAKFDGYTHWVCGESDVLCSIGAGSNFIVPAGVERTLVKGLTFKTVCTIEVM